QVWVWREYYGLDPEDPALSIVSLPDLSRAAPPEEALRAQVNQLFWKALAAPPDGRLRTALDLAAILSPPGLPGEGRYILVFPPARETGGSGTGQLVLLRRQ
ncbi:MAG: hypothetical protein MUF69_03960, partial [Desulfobacterota bacterium]|nr:hypothetical protein [Thermodesulfobacteriota bacterium]